MPGLSCGMSTVSCGMKDQVPWQEIELGPLRWEFKVPATWLLGKSLDETFLFPLKNFTASSLYISLYHLFVSSYMQFHDDMPLCFFFSFLYWAFVRPFHLVTRIIWFWKLFLIFLFYTLLLLFTHHQKFTICICYCCFHQCIGSGQDINLCSSEVTETASVNVCTFYSPK